MLHAGRFEPYLPLDSNKLLINRPSVLGKNALSSYSLKDFTKDARDPKFVGFVFWVFLSGLGILWPIGWSFVFAMMLGFVFFDLVFGLFVKGKQIPLSGDSLFKPKGWLFGAYLVGIGIASIASTLL